MAIDAPVLESVGALVERKGFHRVIECLPALRRRFPGLRYLVVGGPGPEGDWGARLRRDVIDLGLQECVVFLGTLAPGELNVPLSAADVFVLATRNEGWANVLLEAMACGLPVVAFRGTFMDRLAFSGLDQWAAERTASSLADAVQVMTDGDLREAGRRAAEGAAAYAWPRVFGEMAISMVRAGGEGGFLEDALERVASFTELQEDLKEIGRAHV